MCANKLENLNEREKFLEIHKLPRLNDEQEENKPITSNEIEESNEKFRTKWHHWRILFSKEELSPIICKLFQKIEKNEKLLNSFSETALT